MSGEATGTGGVSPTPGAGPYTPEAGVQFPDNPVSPMELLKSMIEESVNRSICPTVIVGPAEHAAQQAGVCSITQAGANQINPHIPVTWARAQIRCIAHTMAHAEQIGQHVKQLLHTRHRQLVPQPSNGCTYLVMNTQCTAEPSNHYDGTATWESLAFYQIMVHNFPVAQG